MSKLKALLAVLAVTASACYFLDNGRVINSVSFRASHPTVDYLDRLVIVDGTRNLKRFRQRNGSIQPDGDWTIPNNGEILDIDADNVARGIEGNGVWVLARLPNGSLSLQQYLLENFPTRLYAVWRVPANELRKFDEIYDIAAGQYNTLYMVGSHRDYGEVVAMCVVNEVGDCTSFTYQNQRGDVPGVLTAPESLEVDLGTGEVYVVDNWRPGVNQPIKGHVMMYSPTLTPSRVPMTTLRADATLAARERYVVALDGTGRNVMLRSFKRPGPSEDDRTLQEQATYRTSDYSEAIAAGHRRSETCGYLWEIRTNREQVVRYHLVYHSYGSSCTPE